MRNQQTQESDVVREGRQSDQQKLKRWRHPEDRNLVDMVRSVKLIWPDLDERLKQEIDKSVLGELRNLDYFAKQKLMLLMAGLHGEQRDDRPESYKENRTLFGLVPLIEEIEQTVVDEEFNQRLTDAVFDLPREKQEELVERLEAERAAQPQEGEADRDE